MRIKTLRGWVKSRKGGKIKLNTAYYRRRILKLGRTCGPMWVLTEDEFDKILSFKEDSRRRRAGRRHCRDAAGKKEQGRG